MTQKNREIVHLVIAVVLSVLVGLYVSTFLPEVVLRGVSVRGCEYSAKVGGIGLALFFIGFAGGSGLSIRVLVELICCRKDVLPTFSLSLAIFHLFSGLGFGLTVWYGWSWLIDVHARHTG